MIARVTDLPDGVLGFEASGKVSADDYERVLVPAIEQALGSGEKISLLYILGDDFEGYAPGAMWDDTKVGLKHPFSFDRIALVTDHEAYRLGVEGFGFLMPNTKVKVFGTDEVGGARDWISAAG